MSNKYLDLDGLTLFKSKTDDLYATNVDLTALDGRVTVNEGAITTLQTAVAGKQDTLTAGSNVSIVGTTISATDTTYTAGTNVSIVGTTINATDTVYTAGAGISISAGNVISATGGLNIHICQTGEYDPTTRIPTIQNPSPSTFYLVPKATSLTNNVYDEYIYTNNAWELIGTTAVNIESISNAEIIALFS